MVIIKYFININHPYWNNLHYNIISLYIILYTSILSYKDNFQSCYVVMLLRDSTNLGSGNKYH